MGDRAKQPSALSRTLSKALNMTVATVITGQVPPSEPVFDLCLHCFILWVVFYGCFFGNWGSRRKMLPNSVSCPRTELRLFHGLIYGCSYRFYRFIGDGLIMDSLSLSGSRNQAKTTDWGRCSVLRTRPNPSFPLPLGSIAGAVR